ncbi:unnamed protein product, partial [Prorocentrum cordatum]
EVTVRYDLDRLSELGTLGHGAFGSVRLVRDAATGQVMALKSVSKGMVVEAGLQEAVRAEKEVMQATDSPFLVKLAACFDRDQELFFLLEPATGGDLYTIYRWRNFFGFEDHARFYMACMACAFAHLHGRGILYRDLKMENVVLDSRGYAKLCDFGTSTFADRAFTMCGTPEYMAPEVFSGSGHGPAADWWTLGVMCFEMMTARTPFVDDEPIHPADLPQGQGGHRQRGDAGEHPLGLAGQGPLPARPLPEAADAPWRPAAAPVPGVATATSATTGRPGEDGRIIDYAPVATNLATKVGAPEEWWAAAGFDWSSLEAQKMAPPHVPTLRGPDDLHNFNCEGQEQPSRLTFHDRGEGWFDGFEDAVGPVLRHDCDHAAAPPEPHTIALDA